MGNTQDPMQMILIMRKAKSKCCTSSMLKKKAYDMF